MTHFLQTFAYRLLLRLHPPAFRRQFEEEMLWVFDELAEERGAAALFVDAFASLARQWVVRSFLQRLLVGDIGLSPARSLAAGLFTWERIGFPERPLPVPRIVQGSLASVAFLVSLSVAGLGTGDAAKFYGASHGTREAACATQPRRGGSLTRDAGASDGRTSLSNASVIPAVARSSEEKARFVDSKTEQEQPAFRISIITKGRDFFPILSRKPDEARKLAVVLEPDSRGTLTALPSSQPDMTTPARLLTAQYDNMRTGANLNEKILTPANVNAQHFGKLFSYPVDGDVYAQPLYLPNVEIPGKGKHNVLFVATESDSVYAFDADAGSAAPLWRAKLADPGAGIKPLSESDVRCFFIGPEIGITSTPVIDLKTGTLYVLARTKESKGVMAAPEYKQKLHALAITTGAEKFGGPVEIKAAIPRAGGTSIEFDPRAENPRAALLLSKGSVYLTWASSCDEGPYYGWVMAYDAQTLAQKAVFNTSPDTRFSGIWQGDAGPAADQHGNVFVVTGNGEFDGTTKGRNFGDTVLKLGTDGAGLKPLDYFTPSNQRQLNDRDNDLGSSGPVLLPDQPGAHRHLLVTAGKEGKIYVIDRDKMGKFQPGNDPHAVQTIAASRGAFGAMAYWNENVFFIGSESRLQDFAVVEGQLTLKAAGNAKFLDSGATPSVSSDGAKDGIVWAASSKNWNEQAGRAAVLYAYDASDVHRELYNSEQNSSRDRAGIALRFVIPSVINGKVYLGEKGEVDVYGLLSHH